MSLPQRNLAITGKPVRMTFRQSRVKPKLEPKPDENITMLSTKLEKYNIESIKNHISIIKESDVINVIKHLKTKSDIVGIYNVIINLIIIFNIKQNSLDIAFKRQLSYLLLKKEPQSGGFGGVEHFVVKILIELCIDIVCHVPADIAQTRLKHNSIDSNKIDALAMRAMTENAIARFPDIIECAKMDPNQVPILRRVLRTEYDNVVGYIDPIKMHHYIPRFTNAVRKSDGHIEYTVGDLIFDILMSTGLSNVNVEKLLLQKIKLEKTDSFTYRLKTRVNSIFRSKSKRDTNTNTSSRNKQEKLIFDNPIYNNAALRESNSFSTLNSSTSKSIHKSTMTSPFDKI